MVEGIFGVFAVLALLLFRFLPPQRAVAITCVAGWILLPVGNFPEGSANALFAYWIIGTLLPSDMLVTKIWVPPLVALAGALIVDRELFMRWQLRWMDLPIFLWCAWPLVQNFFVETMRPSAYITSAYLVATWGIPWLLGRVYFSTKDGGKLLLSVLVAGLAVLVPIALFESIAGPDLYGWVYGPHPFRYDGDTRYVGFRPLGFFENGNQYGIWIASTAIAAIWLYTSSSKGARGYTAAVATIAFLLALMSQSVGAIILMIIGTFALWILGRSVLRWVLPLAFLLVIGCIGSYLMTASTLRTMAETTSVGKQIVDVVRSTGRGSILWRFASDQRAIPLMRDHLVVGTGQWDWWRSNTSAPGIVFSDCGTIWRNWISPGVVSLLVPAANAIWRSRYSTIHCKPPQFLWRYW